MSEVTQVNKSRASQPISYNLIFDVAARLTISTNKLPALQLGTPRLLVRARVCRIFTRYADDARCSAACARLIRTKARLSSDCGFATTSNFNAQLRCQLS